MRKLLFIRNATTAQTRNETLDGKDYLVIPCVMIVEGVHNGSQGALFYSKKELSKFTCCWNMKPVLLRHPDSAESGTNVNILKNQGVGILLNTEFVDNKLKTEIWLDVEKANKLDSRILERIENGEMTEVSTGLFTELDAMPGTWNQESYESNTLNYRPDHLAILLDEKGACSIEDGAGLLRNKEGKVLNELSHDEIWQQLSDTIRATYSQDEYPWVTDVYDKYFIYGVGDKHFQQDYTVSSNDEISLTGERVEVKREVEYKPVTKNQESEMKRDEVIAALIANGKFNDGDQSFLKTLTDEQLEQITANAKVVETEIVEDDNVTPAVDNVVVVEKTSQVVANHVKKNEVTVESFLENAPEAIRAVINQGLAAHNEAKAKAIEIILANKANVFTAEALNAKSNPELEMIAKLAGATQDKEETTENTEIPALEAPTMATLYAPQPSPQSVNNTEDVPVLGTQPMFQTKEV